VGEGWVSAIWSKTKLLSSFLTLLLAVLPFFNIHSISLIMIAHLRLGNRLVALPKFDPTTYTKALTTYKPTILHIVPPILSFLATNKMVKSSNLCSVKSVIGGAAPFGSTLIQTFMDKVASGNIQFMETFGMTETSPLTHCQPAGNAAILGTCGCLVPNTLAKLVDLETGETVGPGELGELCVSGPQVMLAYHRNSRGTKKKIRDHWFHTGDIATYDAVTGQFTFVDRLKELIIVKGLQVAPSELEDLIRRHPGVLDVAVVGFPDERTGETPMAYVIPRNRNVVEQSIIDWVAEKTESHKKLGTVRFIESLPKNSTGKTLRRQLRAQVFKGSFGY